MCMIWYTTPQSVTVKPSVFLTGLFEGKQTGPWTKIEDRRGGPTDHRMWPLPTWERPQASPCPKSRDLSENDDRNTLDYLD